jgi:hypothetical protein
VHHYIQLNNDSDNHNLGGGSHGGGRHFRMSGEVKERRKTSEDDGNEGDNTGIPDGKAKKDTANAKYKNNDSDVGKKTLRSVYPFFVNGGNPDK